MITAAVNHIPPPLLGQLKVGGRMILPLGNPFSFQNLVLVTRGIEDYTVLEYYRSAFCAHDRRSIEIAAS